MKAHLRYLSYVLRHKWFVLLAGLRVRAPLWRLLIHDWSKFTPAEWGAYVATFYGHPKVGELVLIESFEGWGGYARVVALRPAKDGNKGGTNGFDCRVVMEDASQSGMAVWAWSFEVKRIEVRAAFDRAWLHHQHANPHHWQHWVLREDSGAVKALPVPYPLVREMVADWAGAGRAITGGWEVAQWYAKNREKQELHPDTRRYVEDLLGVHFGYRPYEAEAEVSV